MAKAKANEKKKKNSLNKPYFLHLKLRDIGKVDVVMSNYIVNRLKFTKLRKFQINNF